MSPDLAGTLAVVLSVGVGLAGLILALWRDVRAEIRAVETSLRVVDVDLRADIRALRASIDADRVAHDALHAADRQASAAEGRELRAAIVGMREGAS